MYDLQKVNKTYETRRHMKFFDQNLRNLQICHNNGINNIVFISRDLYDQAERYRVEHMIEVIDSMEEWNALSIAPMNLMELESCLDFVDVVVFERSFFFEEYEWLLSSCKRKHITTIFEIDDLVFDENNVELIMDSTGFRNADYWVNSAKSFHKMGNLCDGYWTTNDFLAERLENLFHGKVWILGNFFNRSQEEVSNIYIRQKGIHSYKEPFMLGYFSGTGTHYYDFMEITDELFDFMERHEGVSLKIVGYMQIPEKLTKYVRQGRIMTLPFMDCCSLQKEIAEVDVNLVPLVDNEFTNCKSEIKYFEAAMVGTISCMTPTYVYKSLQRKNVSGYYCRKGEWIKAFEKLYCQRKELYRNFDRLCGEAHREYAWYNQQEKLKKILYEMKDYI